jgi:hypothetical protein
MPEITPEEAVRLRPWGSSPEATFQTYGALPPPASRVAEYGTWTIAAGMLVVRIFNAAAVTTKSTESLDRMNEVGFLLSSVPTAREICRVVGWARSVLVRTAVSWLLFKWVVARGVPLTRRVGLSLKLAAETVIFVFWEPAMALEGDTEVIAGTPFVVDAPAHPIITAAVKSVERIKQIRDIEYPTF